jgi:ketol-acid reductoisomerase
MAKINFGGVWEEVVTSEEFPLSRAQDVLKGETVAVLGYGVQGPGQALNLRDNGIRVIVGQREGGATWKKAVEDGFLSRRRQNREPSSSTCSPTRARHRCGRRSSLT